MIKLTFLIPIALLVFLGTGERATKVKLSGGSQPTFELSGSGRLSDLVIYGPKQRDFKAGDRAFAIWEIVPSDEESDGELVESLGIITYGVVPKGYKQVYPEKGAAPLLVADEKYEYWFQTVNAPHARAYFEIRDSRAVELPPK